MSIILFFLVLIVLILVHELGHFLAAKYSKIRVDEFGIGFPPKIFGVKKGETTYTLNALPIGGFVRIFGEDPHDATLSEEEKAHSFAFKPRRLQALVLIAGVAFNILFAWILFTGGFLFGMPSAVSENNIENAHDVKLLVTSILPDSPAADAGLSAGDEIIAVSNSEGRSPSSLTPDAIAAFIAQSGGEPLVIDYRRSGEVDAATVMPERGIISDEPNRFAAGFIMSRAGIVTLPPHRAVYEGGKMTLAMTGAVAYGLFDFFKDAVTGQADFRQVSGPVGIAGLVEDASALGFAYLVTFTAFISLNLAVINLLPFPALDGGRLVIVGIEAVRKRPVAPRLVRAVNQVGFAALLLLMVAVTYNDIVKLF